MPFKSVLSNQVPFWWKVIQPTEVETKIKVHIDVPDDILYADDIDKVNG